MTKTTVRDKTVLLDDYLKVEAADITFPTYAGGQSGPHRRLRLDRDDAASVLLIDRRAAELILIEQHRWPTQDKGPGFLLEIVAGVVEQGEDPADAARREAVEEAGVTPGPMQLIGQCYPTPGYSTERCFIYAADVDHTAPIKQGGGVDDGEDIKVVRIAFADVKNWLLPGRIEDAKTLIALQWLLLNE